jgi:flagellar biosynthesis GTPase FlhF
MSEFVHERASPLSDILMTSRISTSLCRVIFKSTQVHDATLFMAILQGDLKVLEELGYFGASAPSLRLPQVADLFVIHQPVDGIVRQKAEREAAEKAEAEREAAVKAKAEREAAKKAEAERRAAEKAEAERRAAEKAEAEREAEEEAIAETEASPNESAPEMEIPISGTRPSRKIPPPDMAILQANTGPEQTLKSSHGPVHRPSNRPDASPQPTPPPKSKGPSVPPPELSPIPGPPSIIPLIDIGTSL